MSQQNTIKEIQSFLEGKNNDVKYLVNVEISAEDRFAKCFIHEPNKPKEVRKIEFEPFIYIKDLKKTGHVLFNGNKDKYNVMLVKHGITIKKMKTGNHPRLEDGYPYKVTTSRNYQNILDFFKEANLDPFQKVYDDNNKLVYTDRGFPASKYRDLFYLPKLNEQFFISTGIRLFKGFEEYDHIHKLTFDIETTGLRYEHSRIFAIGVKDNRGYENVLEVEKDDDDEAEINLIQEFFNLCVILEPAVISGYNSENFDYDFILGRAEKLGMDIKKLTTTLSDNKNLWRKKSTVKFGNSTENYMATVSYGFTILDIIHAVKKTAAVNSEIKNNRLKYICQFEGIAKQNRMYIDGADIGRFWHQNPMFILNKFNNNYIEIPKKHKNIAEELYLLQNNKDTLTENEYNNTKKALLDSDKSFASWLSSNITTLFHPDLGSARENFKFENGKNILRRYLLDDLWETEQVDNLYNQSSFLLAKIVPTIYGRVATMGNAAVWNLLMTAWSYENDLAIPHPDDIERFSGGLARCYKKGYTKRLVKIDFASLYPMIQLTHDVFPMFDVTGVIKKMLSYMTTTRNIYKKLASGAPLKDEEVELMKTVDHETYEKYKVNSFTKEERNLFKVKQLPIKILNNSLFGALGSGFAFNWSDNICAARITTSGRIYLRQAIDWFKNLGLDPLLAVTDGVNFGIPDTSTIHITDEGLSEGMNEGLIEDVWKYKGEVGIGAAIEYFNDNHMPKPYMSVDNDGEFVSCLNLSRINYALSIDVNDKETGKVKRKIKFTGNTIKSKTMPEYIEDFIDKGMEYILNGDGQGFVDYYYDYAERIFYKQIPLKKIASKSRIKNSLDDYINRGTDKNGKLKAKQAHMELVLSERENIARKIFEDDFEKFKDDDNKVVEDYSIFDIIERVESYMPPEPELDSTVYYVNTGTRKSHGDVKADPKTGETVISAKLINAKDLEENPEMKGEYNVEKYLAAFNKRVEVLLDGFDEEIRDKILVKIERKKVTDVSGAKVEQVKLKLGEFLPEQLILKNFEHDDYDDSMYLEDKEVEFWNRTGYNPELIWEGFKTKNDEKHGLLHPEIYQEALDYLSDAMVKSGKPRIKSINDSLGKGDYVLIKNFIRLTTTKDPKPYIENKYVFNIGKYWLRNKYDIGYHNGEHIEIVRNDVNVPMSITENRWIEEEKQNEVNLLKMRVEDESYIKEQRERIEKERAEKIMYFKLFCKEVNMPPHYTVDRMDELIEKVPNFKSVFEDYIESKKMEEPDDIYWDESDMT
jgi:DNA polymerase elongation subunit (family B)